jgi:hypothetical protein
MNELPACLLCSFKKIISISKVISHMTRHLIYFFPIIAIEDKLVMVLNG